LKRSFSTLCYLAYFLYWLAAASCATVGTPIGGMQDSQAPVMLQCTPAHKAIRFTSPKITISFDEFIKVKDIQNIVISPLMEKPMAITVKSKTIHILLKDSLRTNTTYTINFGNEIVDITEGNAIQNFRYVFSTGTYIDSLSIKGQAVLLPDAIPQKGAWVMLHQNKGDSAITKSLPFYFTQTDENGQFALENIKEGHYLLSALKDENNNKLYDQKNEAVGFCNQPIFITSNNEYKKLYLSKAKQIGQHIINTKYLEPGIALLVFNQPIKPDYHFTVNNLNDSLINHRITANQDSLYIYSLFTTTDSLTIHFIDGAVDTSFAILQTGVKRRKNNEIIYIKPTSNLINTATLSDIKKNTNNKATSIAYFLPEQMPLQIFINHPIKKFEFNKIVFKQDSSLKKLLLTDIQLDPQQNLLQLNKILFLKAHQYELLLPTATVEDMYGLNNDTFHVKFNIKGNEDLCKLKLIVKNDSLLAYPILALLYNSNNEKIRQQNVMNGQVTFSNLIAGSYGVKILIDINNNGIWDAGNYYQKLQPELIIQYSKNIQLKTGWEQELELK
jgi:uncharacterized protein (DUF2141 family)